MNNLDFYNSLKKQCIEPYFFGLGFIQCKISSSERYHFYSEELKPIIDSEEEIHNHRYDFISTILKGTITNKIYTFKKKDSGNYNLTKESCNPNIILSDNEVIYGDIQLFSEEKYDKGQSYMMKHEQFHTIYTNDCITHLKRTNYKKQFAHVIRNNNTEKICPFSKKMSTEECWALIRKILKLN